MDWLAAIAAGIGGGIGGLIGAVARRYTKNKAWQTVVTVAPVVFLAQLAPSIATKLGIPDLIHPPTKMERAIKKYFSDPETIDLIQKATQGMAANEARALGQAKSHAGLRRLPGNDLKRWNDLRISLADASPALCAGFWTGKNITAETITTALNGLSDSDADDWARITHDSMILELKQQDAQAINPANLSQGIVAIENGLDPAGKQRFVKTAMEGPNASTDDACWAMKILLHSASGTAPPFGEPFIQTLTTL